MAELRIKVLRLPTDATEQETTVAGVTDEQAKAGAIDARYWVDREENILVIVVPITG